MEIGIPVGRRIRGKVAPYGGIRRVGRHEVKEGRVTPRAPCVIAVTVRPGSSTACISSRVCCDRR